MFMCILLYLQILFKYRQNIKYKYAPFCDFQFKLKKLVFKYKYVFEPNPDIATQKQTTKYTHYRAKTSLSKNVYISTDFYRN